MEDVLYNIVPQAGILHNEENAASDSDRVKGWILLGIQKQKHNVANQAGAVGVDRLALTAFQKPSEEVNAPNVNHAKKRNKKFSSLKKQIVTLIPYMARRD